MCIRDSKEGVLVKEITCAGDATEALVDGLEVQTGYIVKVAAVSPVGRSDRAVLAAQTQMCIRDREDAWRMGRPIV